VQELDPTIVSLIIVPDGRPEEASPLQGLSMSLAEHSWMIRRVSFLPSTIFELTQDGRGTMLSRRISGAYPIQWHGQSPGALRAQIPPVFAPYILVLLPEGEKAADYEEWADRCPVRPTIVASDLAYADLTLEGVRKRFLAVLETIPATIDPASVEEHRKAIANWEPMLAKELGYKLGGHNSVIPNLMALSVAGYQNMVEEPFKDIGRGTGLRRPDRPDREHYPERPRGGRDTGHPAHVPPNAGCDALRPIDVRRLCRPL
jgi:hypothetical protein